MSNYTDAYKQPRGVKVYLGEYNLLTEQEPLPMQRRIVTKAQFNILLFLSRHLKFIYSEKATKFCEIPTLLLSYVVPVKSKVEILQNFLAFSQYMNFT